MSDKPPSDQPKDKAYWTERRFTDNGVAIIDGEVIYDGEAEALGTEPLVWFPEPEDDGLGDETEQEPPDGTGDT